MNIIYDIDSKLKSIVKRKRKADLCFPYLEGHLEYLLLFTTKIDNFNITRPDPYTIEIKIIIDEYEYGRGLLLDSNEEAYAWYVTDAESKHPIYDLNAAYNRAMRGI